MERDEYLTALGQVLQYAPGDLEAEATPERDEEKVSEMVLPPLAEGETSVAQQQTPWVRVQRYTDGSFRGLEFPFTDDLFRQDLLGGNLADEYETRSRRGGSAMMPGNAPEYTPTAEELVATADRWQLDQRFYDRLATAHSADDMDAIAETYAARNLRDIAISQSDHGFGGFAARMAVNAFDPAFLLTGGTAGAIMKVGRGATRLGNAMRAAGAGFAADTPLELVRHQVDPATTWAQTAIAVIGSTTLSGAFGSLGRGLDEADVKSLDNAAADAVDYFGQESGSVGAAQLKPIMRELEDGSGTWVAEGAPEQLQATIPGTSWGIGVFGTPLNYLQRSVDSVTRDLGARLSWNPFSGGTQRQTAFEAQRRINDAIGSFVREGRSHMRAYFKAQGNLSWTGAPTTLQKQEFNVLVGQVLSGVRTSTDANVNAAVRVWRAANDDTLSYVKNEFHNGPGSQGDAGRGLDEWAEIESDPSYMMRMFSQDGFRRIQNTMGGNKGVANRLTDVVFRSNREWLEAAAERFNLGRSGKPDATGRIKDPLTGYQMARRIANQYAKTVEKLTNPAMKDNVSPHKPVSFADRNAAREIVRDTFNDGHEFGDNIEDAIDMMMDLLAPVKKGGGTESPRARSRLTLHLDAENDKDLLDMFEWDAELTGMTYRRQLSGYAGFLRAGFSSISEFDSMLRKIGDNTSGTSAARQKRGRKEREQLGHMRDMILGRAEPSMFKSDTYNFIMNQIRRSNFANLMSNVGFLGLSEFGGALVKVGPIRLFRQFPAFLDYYKKARAGDPEASKSLFALSDVIMGHGSTQLRSSLQAKANRYEGDFEDMIDPANRVQERIDTLTRKSANATSRWSGMGPLSEYLRMAIATADAQDWVKAARKGKPLYEPRRMRAMGIDDEMWTRISNQLRRTEDTKSPDTGQSVPEFDLARWDDPEALNVWINAIDRNTRRLVLEGDLGGQALIMRRSPFLQLIFQFLGFPLNAFSKHAGFAMNVHDSRAAAETIAMSFGGSIGYMARVAAQGAALDDERERREFLEERMTWDETAKAAFYYSAHASVFPNLIDGGLSALNEAGIDEIGGQEIGPIFSKSRASGLAGDPLSGNASRSRFYSMIGATGDLFTGQPFSDSDVNNLVGAFAPLGKHVAVQALLNRATEVLPEEPED
jgi:hypothetical protein